MANYLLNIRERAQQLLDKWTEVHAALSKLLYDNGEILDLTSPVPDTFGSINEIGARLVAFCALLASIKPSNVDILLILPKNLAAEVEVALVQLEARLSPMGATAAAAIDSNHQIVQSDPWKLVDAAGATVLHLDGDFKSIDDLLEILATKTWQLVAPLKVSNSADFGQLVKALTSVTGQIEKIKKEAENTSTTTNLDAEALLESLRDDVARGKQAVEHLSTLEASAQSQESTIVALAASSATASTETEAHTATVTEILARATELRGAVTTFQTSFDEFQRRLTEREKLFEEGTAQVTSLSVDMKSSGQLLANLNAEAKRLIDLSKNALKWTSEAGLAGSFSTAASEQDQLLFRAQASFY